MQKTPASLRACLCGGEAAAERDVGSLALAGVLGLRSLQTSFQTRTDQTTRRGCHKPRRCTKSPAQTRRTPTSPGLSENGKGRRLVCLQYSSLKQQPLFISYKYCDTPPPPGEEWNVSQWGKMSMLV